MNTNITRTHLSMLCILFMYVQPCQLVCSTTGKKTNKQTHCKHIHHSSTVGETKELKQTASVSILSKQSYDEKLIIYSAKQIYAFVILNQHQSRNIVCSSEPSVAVWGCITGWWLKDLRKLGLKLHLVSNCGEGKLGWGKKQRCCYYREINTPF